MKPRDAQAVLADQIARARRAIAVERAIAAYFAPVLLLLAWIALNLAGVVATLPGVAASLLGLAALAGCIGLAGAGRLRLRPPTDREARDRLARDAQLEPGELETLEDSPSKLDPFALALWRRAQQKAAQRAIAARVGPPRAPFRRIDPLFLRFLGPAALLLGLLVAGPLAPQRLGEALLPDPGPLLGDKPPAIEAWIAPAAYTGANPIAISDRVGQAITTAPAVDVVVRVTGPVGAPVLRYQQRGPDLTFPLRRSPDGAWEGRLSLKRSGVLRLTRFREKARWRLKLRPDAPPSARFVRAPEQNDEAFSFTWAAADDFGVANVVLRLQPAAALQGLRGAPPMDVSLTSFSGQERSIETDSELNLVDHAYAGLPVVARVVAIDAAGHEGASDPVTFTLPERIFLQPLAKAAIEVRRELLLEQRPYTPKPKDLEPVSSIRRGPGLAAWREYLHTDDVDPRLERAPQPIRDAAHRLDALTMQPQDGYFQDLAVYLGLRAARTLIEVASDTEELAGPAQVLWDVAMRAEYGDSADARRALEAAQEALADALRRGADDQEIARLSQKLREATRNYIEALRQEALRQNRSAQSEPSDGQRTSSVTRDEIDALLQEVQRLSEAGQHEAAAALLERITAMLENLQVQLASGAGGQGTDGEPGDPKLRESIDDLSGAIGRQRGLNDETERLRQGQEGREPGAQSQGRDDQGHSGSGGADQDGGKGREAGGAPTGRPGAGASEDLAERQARLRRGLDAARGALPGGQEQAQQRLNQAGVAMDRAEQALRRGDLDEARRQQDAALAAMRAGADELAQSFDRSKGQNPNTERDPLGRAVGGVGDGRETQVPAGAERQRSREILDELRRRAADPNRSESERAYLRRLLDQFDEGS